MVELRENYIAEYITSGHAALTTGDASSLVNRRPHGGSVRRRRYRRFFLA
jgi:hypothetical protein